MAKAWVVKGIYRDQPVPGAATIILEAKARHTLKYKQLVRAGDVEGVHDMRVNSKRWREALRLLRPGLPRRRTDEQLARIDALNDALGLVRERDVMLEQLQRLIGELPPTDRKAAAEALQPLSERATQERGACLSKLFDLLDCWRDEECIEQFAAFLRRLKRWRARRGRLPICALAHRHLASCVARVLRREPGARQPEALQQYHRLRVAVKRLRYTFEPFWSFLPKPVRAGYNTVARLAEVMGKVHDCDVLGPAIREEVEPDAERLAAVQPLLDRLAAERERLYAASLPLLDELTTHGLARAILDAMDP